VKPFDERGDFRPLDHGDGSGLRLLVLKSAGVTTLSQGMKVAIQLIATIVVARLLAPTDFGLMTMVTTFSLLLMNFGLNGFTEAVIQRKEMDHALASNLFWVNMVFCSGLTIAFAASGPWLARFYGDSRLTAVAQAMALTIFFTGLSVMHLALLRRAMRFAAVSINEIVAQAVSVILSVVLAYRGWGYWALVAAAIALPFTTFVGACLQCQWLPSLPRRGVKTGPMVRFAMNIYGYFVLNYVTRNVDNLLVGWFFGAQALGFYKKAFDLAVFPIFQAAGPLNTVAVPTLSRLVDDPDRYCRYIVRSLALLAFVGMGTGACMVLVGKDVIRVLLGPNWDEAGRIFRYFGFGIGAMFIYRIYGWLHLSLGTANRLFRWGFIELAVLFALFCLALPWGPTGVGLVWGVSCWLLTVPAILYAPRPPQLKLADMFAVVWRYAVASALAGWASATIVSVIPWPIGPIGTVVVAGRVVVTSISFSVLYLGFIVLLHGGSTPLTEVVALVRDMVPRRGAAKSPATIVASA
jgi:O-antigen/teichoic acid export membrane protein